MEAQKINMSQNNLKLLYEILLHLISNYATETQQ